MTEFFNLVSFLPFALFVILWIGFPLWLYIRRLQGFIRIEKTNEKGEKESVGMHLEIMTSIFVIPFTAFFFFTIFYAIFIPFISDPKLRFHKSVDAALMLCAILMLIYIYLAERKIYLRELNRREGIEEDQT